MSGRDEVKPGAPGVKLTYEDLNADVLTTRLVPGLEMPLSTIFEN